MYKNFIASIFSIACCSINTMSVNAGEKYHCSDNPYSYSQYNFNDLGYYILVNINPNTKDVTSNSNQILDNLNDINIGDNTTTNDTTIAPQEQELWLKTYSESTVMKMITNKCVSLLDVYKIAFDNKINANNFRDANEISNLKNKLVKILLQLQKNNTQIFIPDLVSAINEADKISEIQPLAYIDDVLSSYNSTDTLIIYFHLDQLAKHSDNPATEAYNTEDEDSKTSVQTMNNRNIAVYKINLQTMAYSLILHTIDGKKGRVNETIHGVNINNSNFHD